MSAVTARAIAFVTSDPAGKSAFIKSLSDPENNGMSLARRATNTYIAYVREERQRQLLNTAFIENSEPTKPIAGTKRAFSCVGAADE